jgi:hypothetical protein
MKNRKAQSAGGAAAFIAVVTLLIIVYILFLPPAIREDLLNTPGDSGSGDYIGGGTYGARNDSTVLFRQNIGRVDYINTEEKKYDIPTVRLNSPTYAQILKAVPIIAIKNALFDKENSVYTMDFDVEKDSTDNVMLSFVVKRGRGPINIELNGRQIFNGVLDTANPPPIQLDNGILTERNQMRFSVPSPGIAFWSSNHYDLSNVQISADVTDRENSIATQYFTLSEAEKNNLEEVKLFFYPICTLSAVGPIYVDLNNREVFSGIPDCGVRSFVVLDNNLLMKGTNELGFSTTKGTFTLDNMQVKIVLKEPVPNIYYFDMEDDYFATKPETARCGDYDNICPPGCLDTRDADCCFRRDGFWCALPTSNVNDRCVYYVDPADCDFCATGYYDDSGNAPKTCEDKCGDNEDGKCLAGCAQPSKYYDKDCCFAENAYNFWCEEVPISGLADKCKAQVRASECDLCASGFINKDNKKPDACRTGNFEIPDDDSELLSSYDVTLTVRFADDTSRKRLELNINGYKLAIDTRSIEYAKIIDSYVRDGTNSIEIIPIEDVDIAEIKIDIKQVRALY